MPQTPDHRYARAAGRATRSFLDASRRDREPRRTQTRHDAEPEPSTNRLTHGSVIGSGHDAAAHEPRPAHGVLRAARWWWAILTVVFALLTVSFIVAGALTTPGTDGGAVDPTGLTGTMQDGPLSGRPGQFVLAGLFGLLTLVAGTGTAQLLRSRRSAVGILTGIAVICGVPMLIRGAPLLVIFAVVLLLGAALLWLPAVRRALH